MTFRRSVFRSLSFGVFSALMLLSPPVVTPASAQNIDLTGLWQDDTGGGAVYRIRQVGNRVYWIVDGSPKGSFVNLAYGEIRGNVFTGIWVDLPDSPSLGGGNFTLRIESNDRLVKVSSSAYYGAQTWTRQGSSRAITNEPVADFNGVWERPVGTTTLVQIGNRVTGSFDYKDGKIWDGVVVGRVLTLKWSQNNIPEATGVLTMSEDGKSFSGTATWPGGTNPWVGRKRGF
jgi:hypothetical protein